MITSAINDSCFKTSSNVSRLLAKESRVNLQQLLKPQLFLRRQKSVKMDYAGMTWG